MENPIKMDDLGVTTIFGNTLETPLFVNPTQIPRYSQHIPG